MKEILITIGLVAVAMVLLCVRILLRKGGKFSNQHISGNTKIREHGVHCATSQDREARRDARKKMNVDEL